MLENTTQPQFTCIGKGPKSEASNFMAKVLRGISLAARGRLRLTEPRKVLLRGSDISRNLLFELVGTGELHFIAKPRVEAHFEGHLGAPFVEVEQVAFDRDAHAIECRACADVCNGTVHATSENRFRRVHSELRQELLLGG